MKQYSPIALFVYNRPDHTEKTLNSLMQNELAPESELFIFADGSKKEASIEMLKKIELTRTLIRKKQWCGKVTIIENEINKGLAPSIIDGVSKIINEYGKVIVLEDDMITSPFFLQFMNDALNIYEVYSNVACISGYIYPVKGKLPETFFLKGADCWGWATWKRAWNLLDKDGNKLLKQLEDQSLMHELDFENGYPYTQMLKDQIAGENSSWAILWYVSMFLENMYCLYPGISLVQNIGIDGSGIHSGVSNKWSVVLASEVVNVFPKKVEEDNLARRLIVNFFKSVKKSNRSLIKRIIRKLKTILKD